MVTVEITWPSFARRTAHGIRQQILRPITEGDSGDYRETSRLLPITTETVEPIMRSTVRAFGTSCTRERMRFGSIRGECRVTQYYRRFTTSNSEANRELRPCCHFP